MKQEGTIVAVVISTLIVLLHVCSIYVSITSKDLKKNRFLVLALYLSLSDCAVGLQFMYHGFLNLLNSGFQNSAYLYQCMILKHLACGTVISSLLQTLVICLERLNATFTTKKRFLMILTGNPSVAFYFVMSHCIALVRFGVETVKGPVPCDGLQTITMTFILSHDVLSTTILMSVITCYSIVVYQMVKQQKMVDIQKGALSAWQITKKKRNGIRMRNNLITLGLIIIITSITVLPRSFVGFYAYSVAGPEKVSDLIMVVNTVFLLFNPLFDPLVYVLRIKKYREFLRCKCIKSNSLHVATTIATAAKTKVIELEDC